MYIYTYIYIVQDHNNNFAQEMKEASGNILLCSTAFERNDQIMDQKIAHLDLCCVNNIDI